MIREQKNKFWLTLILILSLSFSAFALGVANVFNNRKSNSTLPVDATTDGTLLTDKVGDPTDMNNNGVTDENLWKKNDSTFVSDIGTIYGGTEISVETASDLNTTANDESWHSALRVRVKGTDGTTPYNNTYQPYIQNGYELVGFYFYAGSAQYGDLFESGEKATTEEIDPAYTGNITIKAVCVPIEYRAYLYYSTNGEEWIETYQTFNNKEETSITRLTVTNNSGNSGNVTVFKYWAIKAYDKKTNSILVTRNGDNVYLNEEENIIFTLADKSGDNSTNEAELNQNLFDSFKDGEGNRYFYVEAVKGFSSTINNFKESSYSSYSTTDPAIRATWSYLFNVEIKNTATNSIDPTKVGSFSKDEINDDGKDNIAPLKIANTPDYKYKFYDNTGKAFETSTSQLDVLGKSYGVNNDKYYYVYNYGYEITNWKIYFSSGGSPVYLSYNKSNGKWSYLGSEVLNSIKDLNVSTTNMADMSGYAQTLDAFFIGGYSNTIIKMEPVWKAVNIDLVSNGNSIGWEGSDRFITYGKDYYISDSATAPKGQMIYAYKTKDENLIAKDHRTPMVELPWNYVNIKQDEDKGQFVYDVDNNHYTLTVEPVCVDNIYKISLENGDKGSLGSGGVYTLEKTQQEIGNVNQYKFAKGSQNADAIVDITEADLTNRYDHYSSGSIETYITNVVTKALNEYNTKIGNGTLDILRKVFATNDQASVNNGGLTYTLKETTGTSDFYIYLANNKPAGDLPVFKYGHYDLIAWDNIGTKVVGGRVERAYETYKYNEEFHKSDFDSYVCYINHTHTEGCKIRNINEEPYWAYSEMNDAMQLQAHIFRKNYLLDLNTLREGAREGRYGYILIEINEEDSNIRGTADDKGGKFIAVYDKVESKMQYFDVSSKYENINSIAGKTAFGFTKPDLLFEEENKSTKVKEYYIKLYAGCKLTIISSCVDYLWTNAKVGEDKFPYLDMIGYYLSSVKTTTKINGSLDNSKKWFADVAHKTEPNEAFNDEFDVESGKYNLTLASSDIESKNCPSGSKIAINAYFAPIDYEITISLKTNGVNNPFAGRVDHNNKSTSHKNAMIIFNNRKEDGSYDVNFKINVEKGWLYAIEYLANAGYTLSADAFEVKDADKNLCLLMDYGLTNTSQSYSFALNSAWLINHYYTGKYDATPNFAQTLAFDVNTELYKFAYNVEFVDEFGSVLEVRKYLDAIKLDGKNDASNIALITYGGEKFDKLSKKLIGKEFEKFNAEDFYVVKIGGINYVVLESWLPAITNNNNFKTVYEFLLKSEHLTSGTENDVLSQSVMNNIFGFGDIVASDYRVLTVRIKVSELYTITLKAEQYSTYPDPGYGERTTTIKNHNIGAGNYTNSGTLTTSGREFWNKTDGKDYYAIIYSYKGAENVISSTFNEVAYKGVNYRYVGSSSKIENGKFILDETIVDGNGNVEIIVTYIPKPIETFNVTYQLNGVENSSIVAKFGSANIDGKFIQELSNTSNISLYFGQSINYEYILLNKEGYKVSITLNGVAVSANEVSKVVNGATVIASQIVCQVTENVYGYQSGGFFLIVNVIPVQKEDATIMYVLNDSAKADTADIYGEMEVFVGLTNVTPEPINGMYVVSVAAEKSLSVDISKMAKGYSFVSLKRASTVLTTELPDNKKLTITDSFNFEENNTYFVVIKKDIIRATLTLDGVENDYVGYYNITTSGEKTNVSGNIKSVDAYLGKTLEFTKVDKEKEKLDYYYYLDKDGNEHKIEEANGKLTLKLTSDILGQLVDKVDGVYNINIGVKTIKKYKLTCNVVNEIYAEPVDLTVVGGDTYLNGTYMLDGTKINVNILAKDNIMNADGVTIKEAKYNIKFSGCDIVDAGGNVLTNAEKVVEFIDGVANGIIVLDEDKTLTITITQKTYSANNNEFIYNDIDSYNSLTPTVSTENISSFNVVGDVKYGELVTAKFNRVNAEKGELAVVRLRGNDSSNLIIHIRGKQIVSVYDETNIVEYIVNTDNAKHSAVEDVKIEEIENLKDKLQKFGYNLNIKNDIVEIAYVVKNIININTEYLCYKTIKPII